MERKFGDCIKCPRKNVQVNSKGICSECVYEINHGKTRFEVALEKEKSRPKKIYELKKTPLKPSKKRLKQIPIKKRITERGIKQIELDELTYEEVFNLKPCQCEECGTQLPDRFRDDEGRVIYKTQYSHILGKQAYPEFRNDKRNFNRLCGADHDQWEFGEKEKMKIFEKNQEIINILFTERNEKGNR